MIKLKTNYIKRLSDRVTPVNIYLSLRDKYANSILLESSDYHSKENNFSYICCEPIAKFEVKSGQITTEFPDGTGDQKPAENVIEELRQFIGNFESEKNDFKFTNNGLFGFQTYDAVRHFEDLEIQDYPNEADAIPDILYHAYRFVIAINHFNSELYIFEHTLDGQESRIKTILDYINSRNNQPFKFQPVGKEETNYTDDEFKAIIEKGKAHCQRGDVFQIVLARRFEQGFKGDEFNVYRALRAINPSPYLFYFDYGSYKLFGSSPEAQLIINNERASINPIAGTFKRTGNDEADAQLARELSADPKENAEHVMLVDLARNDLSRHGKNVKVETYREVQFYSHVIHLVSKVSGDLIKGNKLEVIGDTFPAGTLSGAPKYRAMELINQYENVNRSQYGGAIGFLGFDGNFNHAIIIRSFKSQNNKLFYQAGAGVVFKSDTEKEAEEVHHKLRALRKAMELAETL
ncbi:MAG: anthranilate synthase component 1 [Cognaticolwellia sp.]|jgi:anthranilate synthase component 1